MREYYFNCGAGIETTCEPYAHEGQAACMSCNAAISYFNDIDDVDYALVDEFVNNLHRCKDCSGCEEGCSVCGVWFPHTNYKDMPEFKEAQRLVALSESKQTFYPACDEQGDICLWSERIPHSVYGPSCKGCKHETLKEYVPTPVNTEDVQLSHDILQLADKLAENTHEVWATGRLKEGWTYGETRNDSLKKTPCMVPYDRLPSSEKEYDINAALETLKLIIKLGYKITK